MATSTPSSIGWLADYPDPFDFINVLLDGNNIQESNNNNYSYLNNAGVQQEDGARREAERRRPLPGVRRPRHRHDEEPRAVGAGATTRNTREFISNRITNYIYHPVYAAAVLNALAVK